LNYIRIIYLIDFIEAKKPVALVGQTGVQYGLQAPSSSTSAPKKPGSLFTCALLLFLLL